MFTTTDVLESSSIIEAVSSLNERPTFFTQACIDSRNIASGELFVPLKGKNMDGHDFIFDAIEKGASGVLVEKDFFDANNDRLEAISNKHIFKTSDNLKALQSIASHIVIGHEIPVIGITGTNGKTTSKEMASNVLSKKYKVLKTEGNFNNQIGLPLMLTRLGDHDMAVLEMGASYRNDISELCSIAHPTMGVVTNIGPGHLEKFGTMYDIRNTKLEIMNYVDMVLVNGDDSFLMEGIKERGSSKKIITYGLDNSCDFRASFIGYFSDSSSNNKRYAQKMRVKTFFPDSTSFELEVNVTGRFNVYNLLSAISLGYLMGVSQDEIADAFVDFRNIGMRMEVVDLDGVTVLNDFYNANPASMKEAVNELSMIGNGRKVAILGDMLELGNSASKWHKSIGQMVYEMGIDVFLAVGPLMDEAASEFLKKVENFNEKKFELYRAGDSDEASKVFRNVVKQGDTVLIKGSRGLKMEKVLD